MGRIKASLLSAGGIQAEKSRILSFLVICLILGYGMSVLREFKSYDFARADPGWMVTTVISIVEDRDIDLRNQLRNDPSEAAYQTALGKNGQWYPLHEFLMAVVTVPFYLVFGIFGCLIFNIAISILLMVMLFELCGRHVDYKSAFVATILSAFPSLFIYYAYSYSQDVFSAFLLVMAYYCVTKKRFLLAGFIWGLATYARLANAVTIVGFVLYIFLEAGSGKQEQACWRGYFLSRRPFSIISFFAGGLPVALCFFLTNWYMFGSPVTTAYDRWLHFVDGQPILTQQSSAFSCSLLENLPTVLMGQKSGLISGAPLLIVAVAFGAAAFWRRARNEAILVILISGMLIVLFSKYCNAVPGDLGNRYLMAVAALFAIPLAFAVEQCFYPRSRDGEVPDSP